MAVSTPELNDWEVSFPKDGFSMILAGVRRGGKSTIIQDLYLTHWRKTHDATIVFTSLNNEEFYQRLIGGRGNIIVGFNEMLAMKILAFKERKPDQKLLIIFDDCIGSDQKNSESIFQIFTRGRHAGISLVFATQTITATSTDWRRNIDLFVVVRQRLLRDREYVVDNFLSGTIDPDDHGFKKDKDMWKAIMKKYTVERRFGAIVVDFVRPSEEVVFKYLAPQPPDMIVFPKSFTEDDIDDWLLEHGYIGFADPVRFRETASAKSLFLGDVPEEVKVDRMTEQDGVKYIWLDDNDEPSTSGE